MPEIAGGDRRSLAENHVTAEFHYIILDMFRGLRQNRKVYIDVAPMLVYLTHLGILLNGETSVNCVPIECRREHNL